MSDSFDRNDFAPSNPAAISNDNTDPNLRI
jgi:hypothetical protein